MKDPDTTNHLECIRRLIEKLGFDPDDLDLEKIREVAENGDVEQILREGQSRLQSLFDLPASELQEMFQKGDLRDLPISGDDRGPVSD